MKALIFKEDGTVQDLHATGFPVHPGLEWVDCDNTITREHTYDFETDSFDDSQVEIPDDTLDELKQVAITAELEKIIEGSGSTPESIAYRAEKLRLKR